MGVELVSLAAASACMLALGIAACGDDDKDGGGERAGPARVFITGDGYEPAKLVIEVGERVRFVNRQEDNAGSAKFDPRGVIDVSPGEGATAHDGSEVARARRAGFATHSLFPMEWQEVVFPVARTYRYYSAFDPDMKGTITVVPRGR